MEVGKKFQKGQNFCSFKREKCPLSESNKSLLWGPDEDQAGDGARMNEVPETTGGPTVSEASTLQDIQL